MRRTIYRDRMIEYADKLRKANARIRVLLKRCRELEKLIADHKEGEG